MTDIKLMMPKSYLIKVYEKVYFITYDRVCFTKSSWLMLYSPTG